MTAANIEPRMTNPWRSCIEMHSRELKEAGASDERIYGVAAWREAPHFTIRQPAGAWTP